MYQVLFVDDDRAIGYIVSRFQVWKDSEFRLKSVAYSGAEALKLLEQGVYDLVITDIRMPGMDGLELIRIIREKYRDIPCIISSTYSDFQYAKEGMRLGAVDYISKPLTDKKMKEGLELVGNILVEEKKRGDVQADVLLTVDSVLQRRVLEGILNGEGTPESDFDKILESLEEQYPGQPEKQAYVLERFLENLQGEIAGKYVWMRQFMQPMPIVSGEKIRREFIGAVRELERLSRDFQLARQDSTLNQICSIISEHIGEPGLLERAADEVGLSRDYIRVLFKNKTGVGFGRYMTTMRMEYAKELLHSSNLKIYEVAEACGYATIDYFAKKFRDYTGFSPAQFKKKIV